MTEAEELIRSATRAIASAVHDVPPLRLEPAPEELRSVGHGLPRRRWRLWLAPVASVVAVVAVAIGLVTVRNIPNGPAVPRATPATSPAVSPYLRGVPEYYVAWMQASRPYLVVGNTLTGARVAMVGSPSGVYLNAVYGTAADDRTFVVTGDPARGVGAGTLWYLLRIAPGSRTPAVLTPLPVPVRQAPAGVALSPDAAMLAVALPGTPAVLRIYSVATGMLLRSWSTPAGQIMAARLAPGSVEFTGDVLRWSADGSKLAFTWKATEIRELAAAAPDGNLLARSSTAIPIGRVLFSGDTLTCDATQGWSLVGGNDNRSLVCAGTWQVTAKSTTSPDPGGTEKCPGGHGVAFEFPYISWGPEPSAYSSEDDPPWVTECPRQVRPGDGAYIGWANPDYSSLIGSLVWNGHTEFGVFGGPDGFNFISLPPLPSSLPVRTGILHGTVAW